MARAGRRWPLGTQFISTPVAPALKVAGVANFRLNTGGGVHTYLKVSGSASFVLTASGGVSANQRLKGSALFTLTTAGSITILGGGGTPTVFVESFGEASEAAAGLALVDEYAPTHPYLQALSVALKKLAAQGEPVTIGPTGVLNKIARFTGPTQVGDGSVLDDGTTFAVSIDVDTAGVYKVAGTKVMGARITGYTAMTGTANRGTAYATGTITLVQLAERVKAIQDDLMTHGPIGT